MKSLFYTFLLALFLVSCGGESTDQSEGKSSPKDKEEKGNDTAAISGADTLIFQPDYKKPYPDFVSKEEKGILKFFFNDSLVAEIFSLHSAFDSIDTEKKMLVYYNQLLVLKNRLHTQLSNLNSDPEFAEKVNNKLMNVEKDETFDEYRVVIEYMREELKEVDKYLHGIKFTCVAECTEPYYDLILNDLKDLAKESKGESDEKYMNLIIEYYSGENEPDAMSAKWFEATWDYGGASKLGDGNHLAFLKATDKLLEEKNIFEEWINYFREDCFSDMSRWKSYMRSKEKILKEIDKVFKEVKLNESQKEELKIRKKELQEFKENDKAGYGLQLNCENGDCTFG